MPHAMSGLPNTGARYDCKNWREAGSEYSLFYHTISVQLGESQIGDSNFPLQNFFICMLSWLLRIR